MLHCLNVIYIYIKAVVDFELLISGIIYHFNGISWRHLNCSRFSEKVR